MQNYNFNATSFIFISLLKSEYYSKKLKSE